MSHTHFLWAKLGGSIWPNSYHPLICHLVDVGKVAAAMWDYCLASKTKEWLVRSLNAPDESAARGFISFWCATHDLGKASPAFQLGTRAKTGELGEELRKKGLSTHLGKPWPHGLLTVACLQELFGPKGALSSQDWQEENIRALSVAVGGHHGLLKYTGPEDAVLQTGNDHWAAAREELTANLLRVFCSPSHSWPLPAPLDAGVLMFLAGMTSVSDWIGSNSVFFSFHGNLAILATGLDIEAYAQNAESNAFQALKTLGWLNGRNEKKHSHRSFRDVFPWIKNPRPLQNMAEAITQEGPPGLVIVEAPMGEGKTEAAWYLAECWQAAGGQGVYVALPTMATSNQMFSRVLNFLGNHEPGANLMLQHGKAAFNELFESLDFHAELYGDEARPSGVVAERWFSSNKLHGMLAPFGVGTIDQALVSVLQTKHFFVRLFGLSAKTVILDEVHAYDAYTSTLLERLVRWLSVLNCRVILLSATLPSKTRERLVRAYTGGVSNPGDFSKGYPRVTWTFCGSQPCHQESFQADDGRTKRIQLEWLQEDRLFALLEKELHSGGCAVIIRNTVSQAQETYLNLKEKLSGNGVQVILFHARFPFVLRSEIENKVLGMFGKGKEGQVPNPARPHKALLIATQVVEQSLDLDFDLMISDLAPVDLILQRLGRLWRHDGNLRHGPKPVPRLILIQPKINQKGEPTYGLAERIYPRSLLLRTHQILGPTSGLDIPGQIDGLVEAVYSKGPEHFGEWSGIVQQADKALEDEISNQRHKASSLLVKPPEAEAVMEEMALRLEEDDPDGPTRLRAATRDTLPNVQIILIYSKDNKDYLDSEFCYEVDLAAMPNRGDLRRILANEVSLTHPRVVRHAIREGRPKCWKETGALCRHHLVRVGLDGKAVDPNYGLGFDRELGIVFEKNTGGES